MQKLGMTYPANIASEPPNDGRRHNWRNPNRLLRMGARRYGTKCFRYNVKKINEVGNFFNAVEREPVPTRVLNPNASEASYKPKQRSYRTLCTEMVLYRNVAKPLGSR